MLIIKSVNHKKIFNDGKICVNEKKNIFLQSVKKVFIL